MISKVDILVNHKNIWGLGDICSQLPHSLEKVVPILVLQFENNPLFCGKTLTFQSKMNPLFWGKTLTFEPKWTPFCHGKTLNIKINPFFSKFKEVSTKITPFL